MAKKGLDFIVAGVGGQGTVVASDILSEVGAQWGYDVKKSDILGLAVRGGSVLSHVRWAEKVHAPVVEERGADFLVGFEWLETLRRISYIRPEGTVVVNACRLDPIAVSSGEAAYPPTDEICGLLKRASSTVHVIPGLQTALDLGNARVLNIVVMGALSKLLEVEETLWHDCIRKRVPEKVLELNLEAFRRGRALIP